MARTFGVLTAQVRDSFLYPLILNPLNVNKLTCGSVLTLYDNSSSDITVAADICLITLLIVKLVFLLPIIIKNLNVDLQNGVFEVLDSFKEGVDDNLTELKKPIKAIAGFPDKLKVIGESAVENIQADISSYLSPHAGYQYVSPNAEYSATQYFFRSRADVDHAHQSEDDLGDYYNLPRSFQVSRIETVLHNLLHQLKEAVTVATHLYNHLCTV